MDGLTPLGIALIGVIIAAFVFKYVFQQNTIIANQMNQIRILEAIFKQNGGTREQLYPELFKNQVVQKPVEEKKVI